MKAKWTKGQIRVCQRDGVVGVDEGLVYDNVGIGNGGTKYWHVTCLSNGLSISPNIYIRTMRGAKSLALAMLAELPDNLGWGERPNMEAQVKLLQIFKDWKFANKTEYVG